MFRSVRVAPGLLRLKPRHHSFFFARNPAPRRQSMSGDAMRDVSCRVGDYGILPAGHDFVAEFSAVEDCAIVEAPDGLIRAAAFETVSPDRVEVRTVYTGKDPISARACQFIESIATTPEKERVGLDVDQIVLAMATRVIAHAGLDPMAGHVPHRHGLPPALLARVRDYIEAHASRQMTLAELAGVATLSVFHFSRAFAISMGVSPMRYVWRCRIERAKAALRDPRGGTLAIIALDCGFASQSHFNDAFRRETGTTPGAYRKAFRTAEVALVALAYFAVDLLLPDGFWMVLTTHVQAEMIFCH